MLTILKHKNYFMCCYLHNIESNVFLKNKKELSPCASMKLTLLLPPFTIIWCRSIFKKKFDRSTYF